MTEPTYADQVFGQASEAAPRRRGEWGCMKSCAVGCFVILVVFAVGLFILYRNSKFGKSTDPVEVAAVLKETIDAEIPPGYEGKMSVNMSMFGFGFKMIMILPKEAKLDDDDAEPDKQVQGKGNYTFLMLLSMFGADEETLKKAFQDKGGPAQQVGKAPEVKLTLRVGNKDVPATKIETTQNGVQSIQYQTVVKPGVLFIGMGPADKFDKKAMDAFLASVKN